MPARLSDTLRVPAGTGDVHPFDPRATPGFGKGKAAARNAQAKLAVRLADLQEQLFAEGRTGGRRSLLLVLQGLDGSGKGGTVRHVVGQMDPQGVRVAAFGPPTPEERRRGFLWRVRRRLPPPGKVGVFDRSHYEDVVTGRIRGLVPRATWSRRFAAINRFEEQVAERDTRIVKCFLHISAEEFCRRQRARLDDPTKHWKVDPKDLEVLASWDDYLAAYGDVLRRCNTDHAPWYVVPADRKWYRNWAVTRLLIEHLQDMRLAWPSGSFDAGAQAARLERAC